MPITPAFGRPRREDGKFKDILTQQRYKNDEEGGSEIEWRERKERKRRRKKIKHCRQRLFICLSGAQTQIITQKLY